MKTLKQQIIEKQTEAESKITEILRDFLDTTGYVPINIRVEVIDTSSFGYKEQTYIVNSISLVTGE